MQVASATAKIEQGNLRIAVEGPEATVVAITLRPNDGGLKGTALLIGPDRQEVEVEAHLEDDGTRLVATPHGFANLEQWMLKRP
jgi:hypothetical protein